MVVGSNYQWWGLVQDVFPIDPSDPRKPQLRGFLPYQNDECDLCKLRVLGLFTTHFLVDQLLFPKEEHTVNNCAVFLLDFVNKQVLKQQCEHDWCNTAHMAVSSDATGSLSQRNNQHDWCNQLTTARWSLWRGHPVNTAQTSPPKILQNLQLIVSSHCSGFCLCCSKLNHGWYWLINRD